MRVVLAIVITALAVAGCDRTIPDAKRLLSSRLKDPGAVQFQRIRKGNDGTVCGEMNAKNSYGAYTGYTEFVAKPSTGQIWNPPPNIEGLEPGSIEAILQAAAILEWTNVSIVSCVLNGKHRGGT